MQSQDHIQGWTRSIHSRLALQNNHKENKDTKVPGIQLNLSAIQTSTNLSDCMTIQELQQAISQDEHLKHLQKLIIQGWPEHRDEIPQDMREYLIFCDDIAMIDGVTLKGRHVVLPEALQRWALE